MAGSRSGTSTILKSSRTICRMLGKYGVGGIAAATTPQYVAAVLALQTACLLFESLDDFPGEIDQTMPNFGGDLPPAVG